MYTVVFFDFPKLILNWFSTKTHFHRGDILIKNQSKIQNATIFC